MNMKTKRIDYLDTTKAYLIFLVILGHVLIVLNPRYDKLYFTVVQAFIYSFHMPAFFIIHGILFDNEKWRNISAREFIGKRVYTLLIPYLFFEICGILWKTIFSGQGFVDGFRNMLTIRCNVGADWFLTALFMGSLLYLIYIKYPNRAYAVFSTIVSFLLPMGMSGSQLTIVIGRGLLAYGFIMIGNAGKKFFLSEKAKSIPWLAVSLVVTAGVAIIGLKWGGNDFYSCTVGNPVTFVVGGIGGTILMVGVSRILQCKIITYIGNYTLLIMGTHQLVIYAATALFPVIYGGSIIGGIVLLAAIVVFEIPVVYLINRYLPFFVGKR